MFKHKNGWYLLLIPIGLLCIVLISVFASRAAESYLKVEVAQDYFVKLTEMAREATDEVSVLSADLMTARSEFEAQESLVPGIINQLAIEFDQEVERLAASGQIARNEITGIGYPPPELLAGHNAKSDQALQPYYDAGATLNSAESAYDSARDKAGKLDEELDLAELQINFLKETLIINVFLAAVIFLLSTIAIVLILFRAKKLPV